jgi:hypothetical protein
MSAKYDSSDLEWPYHRLVLAAVGGVVGMEVLILNRYAFEAMLETMKFRHACINE